MDTPEIIVIVIFVLLLVTGLVLALRQGARVKAQAARYAAQRGWVVMAGGDERLNALLAQMAPDEWWRASRVMLVEPAPESVYLFGYKASPRRMPSKALNGTACLAQHTGRSAPSPVTIFTRTPLVEKLLGDRVEVGGEEFRSRFTVTCQRVEDAEAAVNAAVERILLEHAGTPGWYLTVVIANRQVLAASFWAVTDPDWDHLIDLARKLREALRQGAGGGT